jgi:PAS domain S-box-containing protein
MKDTKRERQRSISTTSQLIPILSSDHSPVENAERVKVSRPSDDNQSPADVQLVENRSKATIAKTRARETEERLALILEASTEGYWDWNVATGEVYYGQGWLSSLGYSAADLSTDMTFWESLIHPDDLPEFESNFQSHLKGVTPVFDFECRLRARSGQLKWFRNRGKVVARGKRGQPIRMVGTVVDIHLRRLAQVELAESQAQLLALFESTDDIIWSVDPKKFALLAFNRAFENLILETHGIQAHVGMQPDDFGSPDLAEIWKQLYEKVLDQGRIDCDDQLLASPHVMQVTSRCLIRQGAVFGISIFGHDITERKRIEEALRKSEEKFSKAFRESPIGLTLTSIRDHRYVDVNETFVQVTGYSRDEVIGRNSLELGIWVNPHDRLELIKQLNLSGSVRNFDVQFRTKNGEIHYGLGSVELIDIDGEPCMLSAIAVVTERKRAEEALRDSEERLRMAVESGRMYAFEWDFKSNLVQRSPESYDILRIPKDEREQTKQEHSERIHPDERDLYLRLIKSLNPSRPTYRISYRLLVPNDDAIWLQESGHALFDTAGNVIRVVGMVADITESKRAELALRELSGRLITSQEQERRSIARELHDGIGQELALLTMFTRRIDSGISDAEGTRNSDVHELYKRMKWISSKVSDLSHQLHSTELEFLGLTIASERFCRDFMKQFHIEVESIIENVPAHLNPDVALCFYRIIQESLQNVAKHGKADNVLLHLKGTTDELVLKISDDGVGFNTRSTQSSAGLGLISMRERMHLVGGSLSISSAPNEGTTIEARVSLLDRVDKFATSSPFT